MSRKKNSGLEKYSPENKDQYLMPKENIDTIPFVIENRPNEANTPGRAMGSSKRSRICVLVLTAVAFFSMTILMHRKRSTAFLPPNMIVQKPDETALGADDGDTQVADPGSAQGKIPDMYKGYTDYTVPSPGMMYPLTQDKHMDDKIFNMTLPKIPFLPHYKNPCWFEPLLKGDNIYDFYKNHTYGALLPNYGPNHLESLKKMYIKRMEGGNGFRLRCLPYFYIPGVSKCGSTDLHSAIVKHPDVTNTPMKEPLFWNRIGMETPQLHIGWLWGVWRKAAHIRTPKPVTHYIDLYDQAAEQIRTSVQHITTPDGGEEEYHHKITGDGTPSYFYDFDGWTKLPINKGRSEPLYTIADIIAELTPNAKIIIIIRNPTDRLFSDYKFFPTKNMTQENFHKRAEIAIAKMVECLGLRTIRSCIYDRNLTEHSMPLRLRVGMYEAFLQDWFKSLPRENFYITRLEDYSSNREQVLSDMFKFLGLRVVFDDQNKMKIHNKSRLPPALAGGMLNKTRTLINNFYRSWNYRLANLLGDEKYKYGL